MEIKVNNNVKKKQDLEFKDALKNDAYKTLVKKIKMTEEEARKNTL